MIQRRPLEQRSPQHLAEAERASAQGQVPDWMPVSAFVALVLGQMQPKGISECDLAAVYAPARFDWSALILDRAT